MNKNFIKFGIFLLGASLLLASDAFAQYRHSPRGRYSYGRGYSYHRIPRVSIGIGGIFGYPGYGYGYYRGPSVGISVGVVLPPVGVTIYSLPTGARRIYYGGIPYYYRNNVYYMQRDKGYEVVAPPLGATIEQLPRGARLQKIDGESYYEANGTYYMSQVDENGYRNYLVVGTHGELNTEEAEKERDAIHDDDDHLDNSDEENEEVNDTDNRVRQNNTTTYYNRPQVGDQFEQLPKGTRAITVEGKKQYVSPSGTYYKEVTVDGEKMYEVISVANE